MDSSPVARATIASAALFTDAFGRVLLVKPSYQDGWELPGGNVEPGEAPWAACVREVREELAIEPPIGDALVVDWAPLAPAAVSAAAVSAAAGADVGVGVGVGDKILFVFDGGRLTEPERARIRFADGELTELRYVPPADLEAYVPVRLALRIRTALLGLSRARTVYAEHGVPLPPRP